MKKNHTVSLCVFFLLLLGAVSVNADDLMDKAKGLFKPLPAKAPDPENNTVTPEKVALGKMLFFEPRLSRSGLISCNSCHNLGMGGDDNQSTSVGHRWQKGPRNAPTVLNAVFNIDQFWDGRADDLKAQAKGPVQAGVEMANTPARVEETLNSLPAYQKKFAAAFPNAKQAVSFDNMAKAIEAYEATLLTPDSRFDQFLNGDSGALNQKEKRGLALFINKGCVACHSGVNVGGNSYQVFGAVEKPGEAVRPSADKGRYAVTKNKSDEYVFRVAPLRNIALTAPYFHSGVVWSLGEAVNIMAKTQLGLVLSEDENAAVVAFLNTLTGDQPEVTYPILPPENAGTPKPEL